MKTICAYCLKHLRGNKHDDRVSHGICSACQKKLLTGQDFIRQGIGKPVKWIKEEEVDE